MGIFNTKALFSTAIVILFCAGSATADAQQLKGVVADERGTPIRGAQVSISELENETVLWQGTTDSLGVFTSSAIETMDSLRLSVWHYDYLPHVRWVSDIDRKAQINTVLELTNCDIEEVVIAGKRSAMSFQKGDVVVQVAKMKNFERLTTTQLMNRIPGLVVENGQVTLYGQPAEIYINNTKQIVSAEATLKYIESLPAKALDKIRLISMPSGKYGKAAAVVEITMDSKMADGLSSHTSVYGNMMGDRFGSAGVSEFFMYKKGAVTFNTMLNYDHIGGMSRFSDSLYLSVPNISISSPTTSESRTNAIRSSSNLTLELKNSSTLDLNLFIYYDQSKTRKDWSYNQTQQIPQPYLAHQRGVEDLYSITARYATNKEKAHSWSLYYSGLYGSVKDDGDYYQQDDIGAYTGYLTTDNYMRGGQHSLTFDGLSNLLSSKLQLKYGAHIGASHLSDDTRNCDFGGASVPNNNHYQTTELELRAYAGAEYNLNPKSGLSVDLSFEHSTADYKNANSRLGDNHARLTHSDFIPRMAYWYRAGDYRLNVRLMTFNNKPNFNHMLAGQRYVNNYLYTVGNPNLKNQVTYTFQAGQTFWDWVTLNLYVGVVKDNISPYYALDANQQLYQSYANASDKFYATANITVPFAFFDKKLYGSLSAHVQKGIYYNINPILGINSSAVHQFVFIYSGNLYCDITKRLTVQASVSGSNRRVNSLQSEVEAGFSFSPAVSYTFLKDERLTVEVQAHGFLGAVHDQQSFWSFVGNTYNTYSYAIPRCGLKLSYRFNKGKEIQRRDNKGNFDRLLKE